MSDDFIIALYSACVDYHSGQWSRGYRIMSRITTAYRPRGIPVGLNELFRRRHSEPELIHLYIDIVRKYGDKL